jgi:hypothetical protein
VGHTAVKGLSCAVVGIDWDDLTPTSPCQVCAQANIKCLPFPSASSTRVDRHLFRIHSDICGPLPNSYSSFKYFILFIDCYSCFTFIFFLRKKSEALKTFIEFKTIVEKFHSLPIVILQVDNAPEYCLSMATYLIGSGHLPPYLLYTSRINFLMLLWIPL